MTLRMRQADPTGAKPSMTPGTESTTPNKTSALLSIEPLIAAAGMEGIIQKFMVMAMAREARETKICGDILEIPGQSGVLLFGWR
jgi:hypothetical protein